MSDKSAIEWTDATWTPIRARPRSGEKIVGETGWKTALPGGKPGWYCEHESEGCRNCYAESMNRRLGTGIDFKKQNREKVEIFLDEKMLLAPLRWRKPRMIFVCSMTDLFADFVKDEWIDKIFSVMALSPQHTFQVLTKRSSRMREFLDDRPDAGEGHRRRWSTIAGQIMEDGDNANDYVLNRPWPLPNVWLGISCERQEEADKRVPNLLGTPAHTRFVSAEPLLGSINFRHMCDGQYPFDALAKEPHIDWIILGGESGHNARPMNPEWARSIRDQCVATKSKFFFKQWGTWAPPDVLDYNPYDEMQRPHVFPNQYKPRCSWEEVFRVGKKAAGRLLDGKIHDEYPRAVS